MSNDADAIDLMREIAALKVEIEGRREDFRLYALEAQGKLSRAAGIEVAARALLELTEPMADRADVKGSYRNRVQALRLALWEPGTCPRCGETGKHGCGPARPEESK